METSRPTITTYIRDDLDIVGEGERQDNSHFQSLLRTVGLSYSIDKADVCNILMLLSVTVTAICWNDI